MYHYVDRKQLILPFYDRSEFAGLNLEQQVEKMKAAWSLCRENGITPTVWIAPGHCFDNVTLEALKSATPIRFISDGIALKSYQEDDFCWLPQQLWSLRPRYFGLWTVCLHPNNMNQTEIERFAKQLTSSKLRKKIVTVKALEKTLRRRSFADRVFAFYFWHQGRILSAIISVLSWLRLR